MRLKITSAGQVSVPAAIRRRWGTRTVIAEDRGDSLELRPAPDDPIAALRGVFAERIRHGPSLAEARAQARAEDAEAAERRSLREAG